MNYALLLLAITGSLLAQVPQEQKPDEKIASPVTKTSHEASKDDVGSRGMKEQSNSALLGWSGALAGGVAGVIVGIINLVIAHFQRRQLVAQHFREIALKAAQMEWEHAHTSANAWKDPVDESERPTVEPLDYFIVRKLKLMQSFGDKDLTPELLSKKIGELAHFAASFRKQTQRQK
jgi:hypothetical protein